MLKDATRDSRVATPYSRVLARSHIGMRAEWYCLLAGFLAAIVASVIYRAALHQGLESDYPPDIAFAARGLETGVFPGNFLLEILMAMVALFHTDTAHLNVSLFLVLGLATGAKVWLSGRFIVSQDTSTSSRGRLPLVVAITAGGLCSLAFCLPVLPAPRVYLGEIPPNVWHNPSTILLMPFALGLFWASFQFLRDGHTKWLWISLALGALNIAAKPSFVLCFLPIFPCAAFIRFRLGREFARAALLTAAIGGLLGIQYLYVYVLDPPGSTLKSSSGVILAPLSVWRAYTTQIPRAFLASYLFPIVAIVLGGRLVWLNSAVHYALVLAAIGLLEYALLAEQGARALEGNLTWQAIVTQYILLLTLVGALVPWLRSGRWGLRQVVIILVFAAYIWAGIHFLVHWFGTKSYA
jgi:hypothetical protein